MKDKCFLCHRVIDYAKHKFINLASPVKKGKILTAHYSCYIAGH